MDTYALTASKFVLADRVAEGGYLTINSDGTFGSWMASKPALNVLDLGDVWVAPGFVDTHIHGFYNHDVMDCDADGLNLARHKLAQAGTTSWLPTTLTASVDDTNKAIATVIEADKLAGEKFVGARTQGIFLEGPFFTEKHKGAQNASYMLDPSLEVFNEWQKTAHGRIKKSAIAPERTGACEYTTVLSQEGVVVALGHSDASFEEGLKAVNTGASMFVHTYNGMSGLHHRKPGLVGLAMSTQNTYAELICDGLHVHPAALQALINAKGWDHICIVSDCLRCGGMPEGHYTLGEFPVTMKDGICHLSGSDTIAGSVTTVAHEVQNLFNWNIVSAEQAIRMGSEVPARAHHIDDVCGSIQEGRLADFCVLSSNLALLDTYMSGKKVEK